MSDRDSMRTLSITGATGFVGSALVTHFLAEGWNVVALVRSAPSEPRDGVVYRQLDLASPRIAPDTFAGIDAFIHAAYIKSEKGTDAFARNVEGSRALLEAARRSGCRQNVFISSLAAVPDALSEYGKHKFAVEHLFDGDREIVIRPGLVLGNGGLFAALRDHVSAGRPIPLIAGGRQPLQTIYIDDLVRAIHAVIVHGQQGLFTIAEPAPVSYRRFYESLGASLGVRSRFIPIPYFAASVGIQLGASLGLRLPINRDNLLGLKTMRTIESDSSLRRIGMTVRTYEESLKGLAV